jgi:hypothetical protein
VVGRSAAVQVGLQELYPPFLCQSAPFSISKAKARKRCLWQVGVGDSNALIVNHAWRLGCVTEPERKRALLPSFLDPAL